MRQPWWQWPIFQDNEWQLQRVAMATSGDGDKWQQQVAATSNNDGSEQWLTCCCLLALWFSVSLVLLCWLCHCLPALLLFDSLVVVCRLCCYWPSFLLSASFVVLCGFCCCLLVLLLSASFHNLFFCKRSLFMKFLVLTFFYDCYMLWCNMVCWSPHICMCLYLFDFVLGTAFFFATK